MKTVILKLTGKEITVSESELAVLRVQQLVDEAVKAKPSVKSKPADKPSEGPPVLRADASEDAPE